MDIIKDVLCGFDESGGIVCNIGAPLESGAVGAILPPSALVEESPCSVVISGSVAVSGIPKDTSCSCAVHEERSGASFITVEDIVEAIEFEPCDGAIPVHCPHCTVGENIGEDHLCGDLESGVLGCCGLLNEASRAVSDCEVDPVAFVCVSNNRIEHSEASWLFIVREELSSSVEVGDGLVAIEGLGALILIPDRVGYSSVSVVGGGSGGEIVREQESGVVLVVDIGRLIKRVVRKSLLLELCELQDVGVNRGHIITSSEGFRMSSGGLLSTGFSQILGQDSPCVVLVLAPDTIGS